jgi:DNA-binding response OmpR family regulator
VAKILLIDDDSLFREPLAEILSQAGHEVTATASGFEAVKHVKLSPCDLAITDILMPEQDGIETICALRKVSAELKIIAVSGGGLLDGELYLKMASHLGADAVLEKPFSVADILAAVTAAVGAGLGKNPTEPGSPMSPM